MFTLAYPDRARVPRIVEKPLAAAQDYLTGSLLVQDADGNFAECAADPAQIGAVSVAPAGSDTSGFNRFAHKEFPAGKQQGIAVAGEFFLADYSGVLPDVNGGDYGVVRDAVLGWCVDFTEVASQSVRLIDRLPIPLGGPNKVVVQVNPGFVQIL